ncbi:DUF2135 domain-containing protein [Flammeovirga pectinis]|uniref:DUF2135 domain-containing protein n=1 Tax=Flammeovirga pectinis TaxID=2494373 RepID=A0A3S9P8W2_9BACT|nr:VIT domain-containing protein [Flammeovirga pectinis]AZQ64640.1 DUF2135 domain-containing protein [Flammeovirga pectinis]
MKKLLFIILSYVVLSTTLSAQILMPNVSINRIDKSDSVALRKLYIDVLVVDNIATTTMEMHFYNYGDNILKGDLNFPLSAGQVVSRYALDVNGELREGVVVKKEKAKEVFEQVVRQQIDPGILEKTVGENFKTSLYPLNPKEYKKCIVAFDHELEVNEQGLYYNLPLDFTNKLDNFEVHVEVVNRPIAVPSNTKNTISLKFDEQHSAFVSKYKKINFLLTKNLSFDLPKSDNIKDIVTSKGTVHHQNYFYINTQPLASVQLKSKPKKITVLWDISGSRTSAEINKNLVFLESYIDWIKNVELEIIPFNIKAKKGKRFTVKNGDVTEVKSYLNVLDYDGATVINQLLFDDEQTDEFLLFTDGVHNFSNSTLIQVTKPVYTICANSVANKTFLKSIAVQNNGVFIDLQKLKITNAVHLITHPPLQFISAQFNNAEIEKVYPSKPTLIEGNFGITGVLNGNKSVIKLNFGTNGKVTESKSFTIIKNDKNDFSLIEKLWAQKQIDELSIQSKKNKGKITALGKEYSIVTDYTSFIVLDRIEDYVQHEITPPSSLLKEYNTLLAEKISNKEKDKIAHLDVVWTQFKKDIEWWENAEDKTSFAKEELLKRKEKKQNNKRDQTINGIIEVPDEEDSFLEETVIVPATRQRASHSRANESVSEDMELEEEAFFMAPSAESANVNLKEKVAKRNTKSVMKLNTYDSNAAYLMEIKAEKGRNQLLKYYSLRKQYAETPSFFYDVASYFYKEGKSDLALQVISNLAEIDLENHEILRTLGRKLQEFKQYNTSIFIFKKLIDLRPFEPQNFRDLAFVYADMGNYQEAVDCYYSIIGGDFSDDVSRRFGNIDMILLHEMNDLIARHSDKIDISALDKRFIFNMPVDIRIVIDWDMLDTDIDLWVTDPLQEKCYYQHKKTDIGGIISQDLTQGYGPEEFRLKYAVDGNYFIQTHYYGNSKQSLFGPVTVRAFLYTNYGTPSEERSVVSLQLSEIQKGIFDIGTLEFKVAN